MTKKKAGYLSDAESRAIARQVLSEDDYRFVTANAGIEEPIKQWVDKVARERAEQSVKEWAEQEYPGLKPKKAYERAYREHYDDIYKQYYEEEYEDSWYELCDEADEQVRKEDGGKA
jgi:hypothetical protein